MLRHLGLALCLLTLSLLAGCGAGVDGGGPRRDVPGISSSSSPIGAAAEPATAPEVDYRGRRAAGRPWAANCATNLAPLIWLKQAAGRLVGGVAAPRPLARLPG